MSLINFSIILAKKITTVVKGASKIKPPGPKNPPIGISDKALKLWPAFWKKYGKIVRPYKDDYLKVWSVAVAIFKNFCTKRNISPFRADASYLSQDESFYMRNRLESNRQNLVKKVVTTLKLMKNKELATKILRERFDEIIYNKPTASYNIVTKVIVVLPKELTFASPEVTDFLKTRGFDKKRGRFEFTMGKHRLFVFPGESENRLVLNNVLSFTPQHVKFILGLNDEDLKDKKKVIKQLSKEAKNLLKKNVVTDKITAKVKLDSYVKKDGIKKIDFTVSLNEEQKASLDKTINALKDLKAEDIKLKYPIDLVRSLGTPVYQYNLIKRLIKIVKEMGGEVPDIWTEALEKPNECLNPDVLKAKDYKALEDPESAV